jgi:phosphoglycolate phosphatase-like HAD superfamily hydrolase
MNIWLFDLDGVLIHPGGYREALRRTVAHFSRRAGYPDEPLAEETIEAFEANGIT